MTCVASTHSHRFELDPAELERVAGGAEALCAPQFEPALEHERTLVLI